MTRQVKRYLNRCRKQFQQLLKRRQPIPCWLTVEVGRVPPGYWNDRLWGYWHPKGTP